MNDPNLTHKMIIDAIVGELGQLGHIHAIWEGGAVAFGRADEWSDIDLYIAVDDDRVEQTFSDVERVLMRLSPIKQKFDIGQTSYDGVFQAFYRLENTSDYLLIDLAILKISAPDKFLEPEVHGDVVLHVNKNSILAPSHGDRTIMIDRLRKRLKRLKERRELFTIFVQKELNRGNFLEAFDAYRVIVYEMLLELLRMKNYAFHHDFKLRYVYHELPEQEILELESLIQIANLDDLGAKFKEADKRVDELIKEMEQVDFERLLASQMKN